MIPIPVIQEELDFAARRRILNEEIRAMNEREELDTPERRLEALAWRMDIAKRVERARRADPPVSDERYWER